MSCEKRYYLGKYRKLLPKSVYNKVWVSWFKVWKIYMFYDNCLDLDIEAYLENVYNFESLCLSRDREFLRYFLLALDVVGNSGDRLEKENFINRYLSNASSILRISIHTPDGALCLACFEKINRFRLRSNLKKYIKKWKYRYYELSFDNLFNCIEDKASFCNSCFIALFRFKDNYDMEHFFELYSLFLDLEWNSSNSDYVNGIIIEDLF